MCCRRGRRCRRSGCSHVFVTNRTHERAIEMATLFQGTPVDYTRFTAMLPEVDILIASSGAPHYILLKEDMQRVISARRNTSGCPTHRVRRPSTSAASVAADCA